MNFEDKKVFVGNLPLFTKEDEVQVLLRNFSLNLVITELFVWKNKKTPTNIQTEAAFVTLQSNEMRDVLLQNYRSKYSDRMRLPFRNRYGNETNVYITLCYIQPEKSSKNKDQKYSKRNTKETTNEVKSNPIQGSIKREETLPNKAQQEALTNLLKEHEKPVVSDKVKVEEKIPNDVSNGSFEKVKFEIEEERMQLLDKIDTLEGSLKNECSGFFMSLKELSLLQNEFEKLSTSLVVKQQDLKEKKNEFSEIYDLYEQLNSSTI